jgi:hypothetical protein
MGVIWVDCETDGVTDARGGYDCAAITQRPMMHQNARPGIDPLMHFDDLVGINHQRLPVRCDGSQGRRQCHGRQPGIDDDRPGCHGCGRRRHIDIGRIERHRARWIDPEVGKEVWMAVRRDFYPALDALEVRTEPPRVDLDLMPASANPVVALATKYGPLMAKNRG